MHVTEPAVAFRKKAALVNRIDDLIDVFVLVGLVLTPGYIAPIFWDKKVIQDAYEVLFLAIPLGSALNSTLTLLWYKWIARRHTMNLLKDVDPIWLKETKGFDAKDYQELFEKSLQRGKIIGPYFLLLLSLVSIVHLWAGIVLGWVLFAYFRSDFHKEKYEVPSIPEYPFFHPSITFYPGTPSRSPFASSNAYVPGTGEAASTGNVLIGR